MALHDDEFAIDLPLVRALVDRATPAFAGRSLEPLSASGSSNALFRLGDDLLVRVPRQPGGSETIAKEARWLPYLAPALPFAVPEVVVVGEPAPGYPERWSIVRWIDGVTPEVPGVGDTTALARDLAGVVTALREVDVPVAATGDPALRWYRAGPLAGLDADTRRDLEVCRTLPGLDLDVDACLRVWDAAMRLPGAERVERASPRWLHADLVAENLLVHDGRLHAVLDFGALAIGDPTVDLVVGWELLDPAGRALFRSLVDVDDATWERGRAWALGLAVMCFPYYLRTMPARCAARSAMVDAVLADAAAQGLRSGAGTRGAMAP